MTRIVTRIRRKRKSGRYAVSINDEPEFEIDEEQLFALRLREGDAVDEETEARARAGAELSAAKDRALRLLGVRARSVREMEDRLTRAGFAHHVAAQVIEWLLRLGYLDDRRFAGEWVRSRTSGKPMGRRRLRYELAQKGVDRETAQEALDQIDGEREVQLAVEAASSRFWRYRNLSPNERKSKLFAFLERRGFDYGTIRKAFSRLLAEEQDPS